MMFSTDSNLRPTWLPMGAHELIEHAVHTHIYSIIQSHSSSYAFGEFIRPFSHPSNNSCMHTFTCVLIPAGIPTEAKRRRWNKLLGLVDIYLNWNLHRDQPYRMKHKLPDLLHKLDQYLIPEGHSQTVIQYNSIWASICLANFHFQAQNLLRICLNWNKYIF